MMREGTVIAFLILFWFVHGYHNNVRKEAAIKNPETGKFLEVDLSLPSLNLCFEFQDSYHFVTNWASQLSLNDIQVKDSYKHESIRAQGQTIIIVPCWWSGSFDSLQNTIEFYRPDLFSDTGNNSFNLIPLNATDSSFKNTSIPDIDGLMLASFPHSYSLSLPVSPSKPWWLGEKYDGIRVCWNANRGELYGRYGVELDVPEQFISLFGDTFLDCEIWCGRENFTESQQLLLSESDYLDWVFVRKIQAFRILCKKEIIAKKLTHEIIEKGGEGVVLRKHGSLYSSGRSHSLIKIKATRGDKEALVTDITSNGEVAVKLPDNSTLNLPYPDSEKNLQIKVGDVVSYSYEHHSRSDVPVNPVIYRIRKDVNWLDVLRDHVTTKSSGDEIKKGTTKPFGYWMNEKRKNMRSFFAQYASDHLFDPLVASHWYSVSSSIFLQNSDAKVIISYYQGSFIRALVDLFPEVQFDESKFSLVPQGYWQTVSNRRNFFINIARAKGFDPLVAENWYPMSEKILLQYKGANSVAKYYKSSIVRALVHLFPEIEFKSGKFKSASINKYSWKDIKSRRDFFERIAKDIGFDPLIANNWYSISYNRFISYPGAFTIVRMYKDFKNALCQLFPNIGIDKTKFNTFTIPQNGREFFDQFARDKGFDSLVPENWYSATKASIVARKGGITLLKYYGGYGKALLKLYPDIGLDRNRFNLPANHWTSRENRRNLFKKYAQQEGFDPLVPENWYTLTKKDVLSMEGGNSVLVRYAGSYMRTLLDTFPEIGLELQKFKGFSSKKNTIL